MSTLFIDTLDGKRKGVYQKLSVFSDRFVLGGGTAIMLQISHRKSFDFDCFSLEPISSKLLSKAQEVFGEDLDVQVDNSDLLLFLTPEDVKIDFVHYPYPPQRPVIKEGPIPLFNLRDLATNKAYTIGRRATWRDYVDMFFFLRWEYFSLTEIIEAAEKRFKGAFNTKLFLEQLVYFSDIEIIPIEFLKESYPKEEIQEYLKGVVEGVTKENLRIK